MYHNMFYVCGEGERIPWAWAGKKNEEIGVGVVEGAGKWADGHFLLRQLKTLLAFACIPPDPLSL